MYYYERDIAPLLHEPHSETNQVKIAAILAKAKESFAQIGNATKEADRLLGEEENERNEDDISGTTIYYALRFARLEEKDHANALWAAASLMLGIPDLRTEENLKLCLSYLEKSGQHHWRFAWMRLGYLYAEGVPGLVEKNLTMAHFYFQAAHPDDNANFNSLGAYYEKLGMFYSAKAQFNKTLNSNLWTETPKEKAKRHIKDCENKLEALHTIGFHAPDSPKPASPMPEQSESSAKKIRLGN